RNTSGCAPAPGPGSRPAARLADSAGLAALVDAPRILARATSHASAGGPSFGGLQHAASADTSLSDPVPRISLQHRRPLQPLAATGAIETKQRRDGDLESDPFRLKRSLRFGSSLRTPVARSCGGGLLSVAMCLRWFVWRLYGAGS